MTSLDRVDLVGVIKVVQGKRTISYPGEPVQHEVVYKGSAESSIVRLIVPKITFPFIKSGEPVPDFEFSYPIPLINDYIVVPDVTRTRLWSPFLQSFRSGQPITVEEIVANAFKYPTFQFMTLEKIIYLPIERVLAAPLNSDFLSSYKLG